MSLIHLNHSRSRKILQWEKNCSLFTHGTLNLIPQGLKVKKANHLSNRRKRKVTSIRSVLESPMRKWIWEMNFSQNVHNNDNKGDTEKNRKGHHSRMSLAHLSSKLASLKDDRNHPKTVSFFHLAPSVFSINFNGNHQFLTHHHSFLLYTKKKIKFSKDTKYDPINSTELLLLLIQSRKQ